MNCPVCGRRMAEFTNPRRFECTASAAEHERISKAKAKSEQSSATAKKTTNRGPRWGNKRKK